ncbi:MAG: hypothetical protein ACYDAK_06405 [Candidatus Limnocylindrales bacterium]
MPAPFILLGAWLLADHPLMHHGYQLGNDAHIYYRGAVAWLNGGDPWQAVYHGLHFAAPPWVLPLLAPFVALREPQAVALWIALDLLAAAYIVRTCGLSWAWLLFPPLVHGILNGNPAIVSLALMLGVAGPLGLLLRPQMGFALLGEARWRTLAVTALLGLVLIAVLPIATFLGDLPTIAARYAVESGGGSSGGTPMALVVGIVSVLALATVDRREAGFLATIVVVPINGWYASVAALPLVNPILAVGLALPIVGLPTATIAAYVAVRLIIRWAPTARPARLLASLVEPYRQGRIASRHAEHAPRPDVVPATLPGRAAPSFGSRHRGGIGEPGT